MLDANRASWQQQLSPSAIADYAIKLAVWPNSECLGFIPSGTIKRYAEAGQILMEFEGGDACGYLILGNGSPVGKIYQACIEFDLRRLSHGIALVDRAIFKARQNGCHAIELRCRENLEANKFWAALGFSMVRCVQGGKRRGKMLNVWRKDVPAPTQMVLL
jgi:GNAT superfamily N-acetyltransferase